MKKIILILATITLGLTSCKKEDVKPVQPTTPPVEEPFNPIGENDLYAQFKLIPMNPDEGYNNFVRVYDISNFDTTLIFSGVYTFETVLPVGTRLFIQSDGYGVDEFGNTKPNYYDVYYNDYKVFRDSCNCFWLEKTFQIK